MSPLEVKVNRIHVTFVNGGASHAAAANLALARYQFFSPAPSGNKKNA
jgi:hypothetical protein